MNVWASFLKRCQEDPELAPYVGVLLSMGAAALGDPERNVAVLERIDRYYQQAKQEAL